MIQNTSSTLLDAVTTQSISDPFRVSFVGQAVFQASLSGNSGTVSATVLLYGSNDVAAASQSVAAKQTLATFTLSGTGGGAGVSVASNAYSTASPYKLFWAEITAISGTGAAVSLWVGSN